MTSKTKVTCPYAERCSEVDKLCGSCINNEHRSYYRPAYRDYYPVWPYYEPYYPYYPSLITTPYWTTTTASDDTTTLSWATDESASYYQAIT